MPGVGQVSMAHFLCLGSMVYKFSVTFRQDALHSIAERRQIGQSPLRCYFHVKVVI